MSTLCRHHRQSVVSSLVEPGYIVSTAPASLPSSMNEIKLPLAISFMLRLASPCLQTRSPQLYSSRSNKPKSRCISSGVAWGHSSRKNPFASSRLCDDALTGGKCSLESSRKRRGSTSASRTSSPNKVHHQACC